MISGRFVAVWLLSLGVSVMLGGGLLVGLIVGAVLWGIDLRVIQPWQARHRLPPGGDDHPDE